MADSLSKRIGRLISQEFSAFVASLEQTGPEDVQKHIQDKLDEIDTAIAEVRTQLGQELASQHHAKTQLTAENTKHTALTAEIDRAVADEATARAEAAIAKQLDIEAQVPLLEAQVREGQERIQELEQYIRALQARKREIQREVQYKIQEEGVLSSPTRSLVDGEADARLAELDDVVRRHTIAERLAAAKERIKKS